MSGEAKRRPAALHEVEVLAAREPPVAGWQQTHWRQRVPGGWIYWARIIGTTSGSIAGVLVPDPPPAEPVVVADPPDA